VVCSEANKSILLGNDARSYKLTALNVDAGYMVWMYSITRSGRSELPSKADFTRTSTSCTFSRLHQSHCVALPYLTLPSGWADYYTCPALRPYQFGPMRNPDVTIRSQWSAVKPKSAAKPKNHQPRDLWCVVWLFLSGGLLLV